MIHFFICFFVSFIHRYLSPFDNTLSPNLPGLCSVAPRDFFISQLYLLFVLSVLFCFSWSSRRQPFTSSEGNHVFVAAAIILPLFVLSIVLCEQFSDELPLSNIEAQANAMNRDITNSICMIAIAFASLCAIFGPLLYQIHKYGVLPRKAASYADSLSTAFTVFRGGNGLPGGEPILAADAMSQNSSRSGSVTGSGVAEPTRRGGKPGKRVDQGPVFSSATNSYNYFSGPNQNFRLSPRVTPLDYLTRGYPNHNPAGHGLGHHRHHSHHMHPKSRNPLYEEQHTQYRSAYP